MAPTTAARPGRRNPFRSPDGPRRDDGLFGPGSMTWRVWSSASAVVAAYRAVIVQMLNAPVGTGVADYSDYQRDPMGRLRRTGHFFSAYALGDTRTVEALSRQLHALHRKVKGVDPTTGRSFQALQHDLLLYVHVTGWHSALLSYERFNAPLTHAERCQYWQEAAVGTEYIGLPGELVPSTPQGVRNYFDEVNPRLAYSQPAMHVIDWFKHPHVDHWRDAHAIPPVHLLKAAVIPTLPAFVQRMTGLQQSAARSAVATAGMRQLVHVLDHEPGMRYFQWATPETYDILLSARARLAAWERETRPPRRRLLRAVAS